MWGSIGSDVAALQDISLVSISLLDTIHMSISRLEPMVHEKAMQGGDAEKFKVLADMAKELMSFAEKVEGMQSDKGQKALDRFNTLINKLSVDSFEQYNKLR